MCSTNRMMSPSQPFAVKFWINQPKLGMYSYHFGFQYLLLLLLSEVRHPYSWSYGRVVPTVLGTQPIPSEAHSAILVNEDRILVVKKGVPLIDSIWFLEVSISKSIKLLCQLDQLSFELLSKKDSSPGSLIKSHTDWMR